MVLSRLALGLRAEGARHHCCYLHCPSLDLLGDAAGDISSQPLDSRAELLVPFPTNAILVNIKPFATARLGNAD
jgi:hypothetical protein